MLLTYNEYLTQIRVYDSSQPLLLKIFATQIIIFVEKYDYQKLFNIISLTVWEKYF